jgi:hypothetical protein
MPFYGESAKMDWANVIAGAPFDDGGSAMTRRDGTTSTLGAGDSFIVGFYDYDLFTADANAAFELAVEAVSGSATLRFSGGVDPNWSLDDPTLATADLGTHAVAAGITAVPMPFVDNAAYFAQNEETIVFVEVLSGAVEVEQLRLRIWPPGGPAGALSAVTIAAPEATARDVYGGAYVWGYQDLGNPSVDPPIPPDWGKVHSEAYASPDAPSLFGGRSWSTPEGSTDLARWPQSGGHNDHTNINGSLATLAVTIHLTIASHTATPPGEYGVDWIMDPDSTEGNAAYPEGPGSISWAQPLATIVASRWAEGGSYTSSYVYGRPGQDLVRPSAVPVEAAEFGGMGDGPSQIVGHFDVSQVEFDEQGRATLSFYHQSLLSSIGPGGVLHSFIAGTVDPTTTSGTPGVDVTWEQVVFPNYVPLRYIYTPAPYRYWNPLASPPEEPVDELGVGYFVRPSPNLDGLEDRIEVNFN